MNTAPAPEEILARVVAIPSVSSLSNLPLIECIRGLLAPLRWHHRLIPYKDANGVAKANLLASPAPFNDNTLVVELALLCHTDTVPYAPEWAGATQLRAVDGNLHACGACDVKGFLACVLSAAFTLDTSRLRRPLCLVFTADEEIGCHGARRLVEQNALRAKYAIVGEPTSLIPAHAGKGYCLTSITVHGQPAHSAYPGSGASAIFAASRLLTAIEALATQLADDRDETFSPPCTTLNVGEIHGGTAKNIVPAECSFLLEWRPIPAQAPEHVAQRVRALAEALEQELGPAIRISIDILRLDPGFSTSPESPVVRALLPEPSAPVQTVAFGTEAPWMQRLGAEAVVIGPGSMLTAHSERECVPAAELTRCTAMLRSAIETLCA